MSYPEVDGFVHGRYVSFDGTELAYQAKEGDTAPSLVLSNGLGGSFKAWQPFIESLGGGHRLVSWDYRGLYRSDCPSDLSTLAVEDQCEDLRLLMDHTGVERAVLLGWSMGVQLNFEFYARYPERVLGIVACNGTSGRPFATALRAGMLRQALPTIATLLRYSGPVLSPVMGRVGSEWISMKVVQTLGLMANTVEFHMWEELAGDFASLDLHTYFETLRRLGDHDVDHVLPGISVPVLIIAGRRDLLTPAKVSRRMAAEIPDAELMLVRGGTHYCPLEFPELLALRVEKFLRERIVPTLQADRPKKRRGTKRATA